MSVCYRSAWDSVCPLGPPHAGHTFVPENPLSADWDWPFRRIDHFLVSCEEHGGPTLRILDCARVLDSPETTVSDYYGLLAALTIPDL